MEELEETLRNPYLLLIVPLLLWLIVTGITTLIEQKTNGGNR